MKQMIVGLILAILVLLPFGNTHAQAEMGITGTLGLPAGYMNLSVNGAFYTRVDIPFPIHPELMLAESFSTKGDGAGGRLSMNVLSGYLLARYSFASPIPQLSPFAAAGAGIHFMYSFSSDQSALGEKSKSILLSKAHLFFGLDFDLTQKLFLMGQGRLTYPSEIILDSGYLGLGVRL
jgi:hypothetical protein